MRLDTPINRIPKQPIISRFVAPWDTSGWYSVFPDFSVGKRLYSNSEVCVASLPEQYCGWEYVMTFDSKQDGFDDKQEVDFYLEQDATVFVALDKKAPADFLSSFEDTGDEMVSSDGCSYRILSADYHENAQVHIPGFTGDYHHFVVFVRPQKQLEDGPAFETIITRCILPAYPKRDYTWYFHEVFNKMPDNSAPTGFSCHGDCRVMRYPHSPQRKYVALWANAVMEKQLPVSKQVILELSIQVFSGAVSINFCGASLTLLERQVTLNTGHTVAISDDACFDLRFIRNAITGCCTIWVNNRVAGQTECTKKENAVITITASNTAMAALDRISLRDDTEIFVVQEDFNTLPESLVLSNNAKAELLDYPFDTNKSLCLSDGACTYAFPPVTGIVSIETKVKAENNSFVLLPELRDADGSLALRIAMYKNNLYASNGEVWKRIFAGSTDWMYYPCENWYNIKITANLPQGTYDVYVDGSKRVCSFPLTSPVRNIAQIGFLVQSKRLYVNELRVYDAASICRGLMPPNEIFDVTKPPYNAFGDGETLETQTLQRAIDDAAYSGGTVYLHDGIFFTGSLQLHSDITFFIDPSAVLLGTQDHNEYPLYTPGDSLCAARQLGRGILYGQNLCNVRVTGGGTLDGQGLYRFKMNDPADNRMSDSRPCMIYITYSNGIALDDIRFQSSAYWTVVPLSCRNILMQYLDLDCMNTPNRDGIDPVDCRDMTIRRCNIMAGDDGLCFKSSDTFGCENIDVRDMMIQSLASGIKFGTDTYYSLKNTSIRNCAIKNVNRCGISLESVDGAAVSNVIFEEIDMTNVGAPVYVTIGMRGRVPRGNSPVRKSSIDGVQFVRLRFDKAYPFSFTKNIRENMIVGQSADQVIRNVTFSNCYFELPGGFSQVPDAPEPINKKYPEYDSHGLSNGHAFCIRYAENIVLKDCKVQLESPDIRPMIGYSDYTGPIYNG